MSSELPIEVTYHKKHGRTWKHIRQQLRNRLDSAPVILVDCSYDDLMRQGEINSRNSQLIFCYSTSMKMDVERPLRLSVIGASTSLFDFLQRVQMNGVWSANITTRSLESLIKSNEIDIQRLVYLTADADNEINTYCSSNTYIIGGLVDRNRHNGITLRKAQALGIRTGKLPLHKYCDLTGSIVLSINHIFSFMTYLHCGMSFKEVVDIIVPRRKLKTIEDPDSDQ